MKKILLIALFLVAFVNLKAEQNPLKISDLVQKFISFDVKIKKLQEDGNSSKVKDELESLKDKQNKLLETLPSIIAKQELDEKKVQVFLDKKESLSEELKALKEHNELYYKLKLELAFMQNNELFYSTLFKLEEAFKNAKTSEEIESLLSPIVDQLNDFEPDFKGLEKDIKDPKELSNLKLELEKLNTNIKAYRQILQYFRDNAKFFENNIFFSMLKLQNYIDWINEKAPFQSEFLDLGKIIISLIVLVFFYLIRKLVPHFVYFVLIKIIFRNKDKQSLSHREIEDIFVEKSNLSMQSFLFFYGLGVCASVLYYPLPVPIWLGNSFYVIYALNIAWIVINAIDGYGFILISNLAQKSGKKEVANLIFKVLYFVIVIIVALFMLSHLGFNISAIIASLGIGGLAVALAAKDIIANFFSSIILAFDDSFNQGDWVEISGVEGTVVETGLRKTTIRTFDNSLVFFPNSVIMAANVKNWSKRKVGRRIVMKLGVGYDASAERLEKCINELRELLEKSPLVAHASDSALKQDNFRAKYRQNLVSMNDLEGYKNACYVSLCEFAESSINIELYFYTKAIDSRGYREARQALMLDFMRIIAKNGLVFAYPSMSLYVENFKDLNEIVKKKD
ncbi:mechanosensitive ion channel protein [Campylobacter sp. MIT 99-7217]|uniref:mechanosensitive ion channel family protein n=1 Tax=Campylobacter sp. MIT 99-7217 TaxID=535091 RepID=UPI0011572D7E|nr:mechanosensitive ion channel family protein [Campylobacter sp. MIT 99-7217]TQR30983.1 mechanosensitive ion channel protein [Campylobacter sp. MIT 99-7217]